MKKIIVLLFISIICISAIGCSNENSNNVKIVNNIVEGEEVRVYGENDVKAIKSILKDYGRSNDLQSNKAIKKNIVVIHDKEIIGNEKIWNDFYDNSKKNKNGSVTIVKYTEQGDPILSYLSYIDGEYFMVEDNTRDRYMEGGKDYYEYKFKYLRLFEDYNFEYAYLLDDKDITLNELNYSLCSSDASDWVPYGFVFYINK